MEFQLASGERLLWRGAPAPGVRFHAYDLFLIPFGIFWLFMVLAIFGVLAFGEQTETDPVAYVMLPFFLLIGVYFVFGRFLTDMIMRGRTEYALTSRRAVIESGYWRKTTRSVNLAAVAEIRFNERRGGRGTIEFGSGSPFPFVPRGWPGAGQFMSPAFDGIDDARHVFELALTAQRDALQSRQL
jgi:PH (Pleckstrin Homology) domain-containing protein